jgi:hypothetical protein
MLIVYKQIVGPKKERELCDAGNDGSEPATGVVVIFIIVFLARLR